MATCKNGHYYPDDKAECPYCPKSPAPGAGTHEGSLLRTVIGVPPAFENPPAGPQPAAPEPVLLQKSAPESHAVLKTQIGSAETPAADAPAPQPADRKLMGWLVTFDRVPMGQDFQLREGRNVIGTAPDCDVRIEGDANVSGRHLTILFRLGEVLFRDELSTNGTFINSNLSNEGRLRDGDLIRVGNTHLLFRSAQTHHADETI